MLEYLSHLPPFDFNQALGLVATVAWIWSMSLKSDRRLNQSWVFVNAIWCVHWALLGGWVGAANVFINVLRSALYLVRDWKNTKYKWHMMVGLIVAYSIVSFPFMKDELDLLPVLASYTSSLAFFIYSGVRGRVILVIGHVGWLFYAIAHLSYGGMISTLAVIGMGMATIYRLLRDKEKARLAAQA